MPLSPWPQVSAVCDAANVTSSGPVPDPDTGWRALLAEAARKSDFLWIRRHGEQRAWPAWHVWHEEAVTVVSGGGEQILPSLEGPVDLLVRSKDTWQRLLTVPAQATTVSPDDERWAGAASALAAARLNAPVPPADLPGVWRGSATITRIDPVGPPSEQPGDYDVSSHAAPPPPTPATRSGWRPWHAGGRRRRRRRT
jgi:hypothetical protein